MKKIFLDSDVILDGLLERPVFDLPALNIFALAYQRQIQIVTSPVAFVNVNYFLRKFDSNNRAVLLNKLRSIISIITIGEPVIDLALKSKFTDFEDAVQYYTAISANADVIVTRNIKHYTESAIPVLTPEQFLQTL